jgi:hypothetical protein
MLTCTYRNAKNVYAKSESNRLKIKSRHSPNGFERKADWKGRWRVK